MKNKNSFSIEIGLFLRNFTLKTQNKYLIYTLFSSVFSCFLYSQEKNISIDSITVLNNNNTNLSFESSKPVLYIADANALHIFNNSLYVQEGTTIIVGNIPTEDNIKKVTSICTTIKRKNLSKPSPKQEKIIKDKAIVKSFPVKNNPLANNVFGSCKAIVISLSNHNNKLVKLHFKPINQPTQYHILDYSRYKYKEINLFMEEKINTPLSKFLLTIIARPPPYWVG